MTGVDGGFRYYVGFAGGMDLPKVMGSLSTNPGVRLRRLQGEAACPGGPHRPAEGRAGRRKGALRRRACRRWGRPTCFGVLEGPGEGFFHGRRLRRVLRPERVRYSVSPRSNRTGIRARGRADRPTTAGRRAASRRRGSLPGTVQVPPDGKPIIMLHEKTMGGYARAGVVVRADLDRLAHLKPKDRVLFDHVTPHEALRLKRNAARGGTASSSLYGAGLGLNMRKAMACFCLFSPVLRCVARHHFAVATPPSFFASTSFALSTSAASLPEISQL